MQVYHVRTPNFPQFRFEWHAEKKRVYIIRMASPDIGDPIAFDIETHGDAINAVLVWLRGYREAKQEIFHAGDGQAAQGQALGA